MLDPDLVTALTGTLDDLRLSRAERQGLAEVLADLTSDRDLDLVRDLAFSLARQRTRGASVHQVLEWLEAVMRVVAGARDRPPDPDRLEVWFSPGTRCGARIVELIRASASSLDACVFSITDDRISRALLAAHRRGVAVRVITDDAKVGDLGSDIIDLADRGVPVAVDDGPAHMHHKFAVFDRRLVVTGSYNWTRSAATENYENVVVSADPGLVERFAVEFDRLWRRFRG
jgi:phosphatidylserine/phosphatidylglycerophosphate/cardiolipin synthase-like enzyme